MPVRLWLLRHAHTDWNRVGKIQGRKDQPIDERARVHLSGLRLPQAAADALLVASPLSRAVETARLVGRRQPQIADELIEMDWGAWEGRHGVDLLAEPGPGYRHIEEWGWDFEPPGGETPAQVWLRLQPFVSSLRQPTLAVTHIGVMRVLLAQATGWNFEGVPPFSVKRDRLYGIDVHPDGSLAFDGAPVRLIASESP